MNSEVNPHFANIISPREYIVVSRFHVELEGGGGELHVALPYSMLEPIRERSMRACKAIASRRTRTGRARCVRSCRTPDVEVSSCLAQRQISLRALSRLKVGDVLPIDLPKQVSVEVEGTPLFAGEFGTHNGKNAIKITHVNQRAR